ncbi:MAG: hypothetical protein IJM84_02420, partial [Bacteroidaceae bacterium]|nr:hypothetical protein [Bacteroidaceae bacterium]
MRKITNLLTLLLLAICSIGASAETATLTYDNIEVYKSGALVTPTSSYSYNHQVRSTTDPLITISIGTGDVVYNTSKFCFGNNNRTYTLAVEGGYVITSFSISYSTGSGVKFTSNGVTSEDDGSLYVEGLSTASTTFTAGWTSAGSSGSWQNYEVREIVVNYEMPGTVYNYTYTLYDGTTFTTLGSGSGTATGTSSGYMFTLPDTPAGYAYMGAADPATMTQLNLSGSITATNIALIYSPIITDLANTSSTKVYTLTTPRGYFYAESATQLNGHAGTADALNSMHQWTFVTMDGNMYLYNVGTKKLATFLAVKGRDLVTSAPAVLTTEKSETNPGYPLVFKFTNSEATTYTMNMNGSCIAMIDTWTEHDKGNTLQIVQVPQ